MQSSPTDRPLADVEFLARSDHRAVALAALARRPQSRADLLALTGVSQSTMGRTLRAFEARNWIRRDGQHYEATAPGAYVAGGLSELVDRVETERRLRDVWRWLPEEDDFTVDLVADAEVSVADAGDPYRPVTRFLALLRETDRFRFVGFDVGLLEPCREELCRRIVDGMETEFIAPPTVVDYIRSTYPEQFAEALGSGNLAVRVHDDLPRYGVCLFDDRVAVGGFDPDTGSVRVLVDTDGPSAREWAESTYRTYRRELPTLSLEGDRGVTRTAR